MKNLTDVLDKLSVYIVWLIFFFHDMLKNLVSYLLWKWSMLLSLKSELIWIKSLKIYQHTKDERNQTRPEKRIRKTIKSKKVKDKVKQIRIPSATVHIFALMLLQRVLSFPKLLTHLLFLFYLSVYEAHVLKEKKKDANWIDKTKSCQNTKI